MKIAVSATGTNLQDPVDPRFGRAAYILIVESDTMEFEVLDNSPNINALKGAGIQTATTICDRGAEVLLTGYCGPNAFRTAQAAGMKVVTDATGTVNDAVRKYLSGSLTCSNAPNAEGHW